MGYRGHTVPRGILGTAHLILGQTAEEEREGRQLRVGRRPQYGGEITHLLVTRPFRPGDPPLDIVQLANALVIPPLLRNLHRLLEVEKALRLLQPAGRYQHITRLRLGLGPERRGDAQATERGHCVLDPAQPLIGQAEIFLSLIHEFGLGIRPDQCAVQRGCGLEILLHERQPRLPDQGIGSHWRRGIPVHRPPEIERR